MKKFSNSEILRGQLEKGIETIATNVASTLGPKGRTVILHPPTIVTGKHLWNIL